MVRYTLCGLVASFSVVALSGCLNAIDVPGAPTADLPPPASADLPPGTLFPDGSQDPVDGVDLDNPEEPVDPPGDGVARPEWVHSTGFFVREGEVYDPNGHLFRMRGLNHTHWWGSQDSNNAAIAEFGKTGANAIRVVFGTGMGDDTPAERRAVVERYLDERLVPIVEDHRGTCETDPSFVTAATNEWLLPDNQAWLKQYEKQVILNITNEWGPFDSAVWAGAYEEAITRLRDAGIRNLIMIDAGGACGQNPRTVLDRGQQLLDHDPEHNLVFSVHMYAYWRTAEATDVGRWNDSGTQSPWSIRDEFQALRDAGIPIIVGEIGWEGSDQVRYQTKAAIQTLDDLGVGFLAWSWNQNSDSALDLLNGGHIYNSEADLSEGGRLFLRDPDVGFEYHATPSTAFD